MGARADKSLNKRFTFFSNLSVYKHCFLNHLPTVKSNAKLQTMEFQLNETNWFAWRIFIHIFNVFFCSLIIVRDIKIMKWFMVLDRENGVQMKSCPNRFILCSQKHFVFALLLHSHHTRVIKRVDIKWVFCIYFWNYRNAITNTKCVYRMIVLGKDFICIPFPLSGIQL